MTDRAVRDLRVPTMASAVLGLLTSAAAGEPVRLAWSNAGHPPAVLATGNGRARLLEREPDLLLGLDPRVPREEHTVDLPPGSTLLLYTDGLVERRGEPLETGLDRLAGMLAELAAQPVQVLVDERLSRLLPESGEDDVALLAVRVPG